MPRFLLPGMTLVLMLFLVGLGNAREHGGNEVLTHHHRGAPVYIGTDHVLCTSKDLLEKYEAQPQPATLKDNGDSCWRPTEVIGLLIDQKIEQLPDEDGTQRWIYHGYAFTKAHPEPQAIFVVLEMNIPVS